MTIRSTVRATKNWSHLIKLNQVYAHSYYTENNNAELITDGTVLMDKLMTDIRQAKESVNIEYYIIKRDFVGMALIKLLTEKAKEGLEVRLLVDVTGWKNAEPICPEGLSCSRGKSGILFQIRKLKFFGIRLNYRNDRKIVVIDNKIGYTGGYNVAKEYIGRKKKFGYWRDTHVRIVGGAVMDLYGRFVLDWRFTTKEKLHIIYENFLPEADSQHIGMQIVSCGPESPSEEVKRAMMRMITFAEKRVYLQTPYFVPDRSIVESR